MRKMIRVIGPLAICLMLFASLDAVAKPSKKKGKKNNHGPNVIVIQPDNHGRAQPGNHDRGNVGRRGGGRGHHAVRHHGGPPPWAPAHGYRSQHRGGGVQAVYVAPYGIDGGHCNRKEVGLIVGGITGGLIGAKITSKKDRAAGIIGGAILGAIVGSSIGKSMDKADHHCVGQALEHAPDSRAITWSNPDRGAEYRVTPTQTYQTSTGGYCREYQTISTVNGRPQETYGTACRQPDGAWKLVN